VVELTISRIHTALVRHTKPAVSTLSSVEDLEAFLDADSNIVVSSGIDDGLRTLTPSIADSYSQRLLVGEVNGSVAEALGPSPALLCYKRAQSSYAVLNLRRPLPWSRLTGGDLNDVSKVASWLDSCAEQAVHRFNRRKVQLLYSVSQHNQFECDH
jgi:hypothetical protein